MTEVLTSFCARLYGRRSARNRPKRPCARRRRCRRHDVEVTHLRSIALPFVVVHPPLRVCGRAFASRPPTRTYYGSWAVISARSPARTRSTLPRAQALGQAAGAVPPRAQAGDHRRELVALGRSDHSHERGLLAARLAQPCRRATDTRLPYPPDRAEAHGPVGERRGFKTRQESYEKRRRLQHLRTRLAGVERRLEDGRVSICRGGSRLAKARHNLDAAGLSEAAWRERWEAERLFICADGEAGQLLGNLTVRWHPDEHWLELRLPKALEHLANRPGGRYRLSCPVVFAYRGEEVAAQAESGAVRYDVFFDPGKHRWYLDASWSFSDGEPRPDMEHLRSAP